MVLFKEYLQSMIHMQLPCLHIMYTAGDDEEVVVLALLQVLALCYCSAHDVLVLLEGDVRITVSAEHIIQLIAVLVAIFKGLADSLNFLVVIAEGTAAT